MLTPGAKPDAGGLGTRARKGSAWNDASIAAAVALAKTADNLLVARPPQRTLFPQVLPRFASGTGRAELHRA